jgi:hypothetical protein
MALFSVGETEPARVLGEDTLARCRRALGENNPITLYVVQALHLRPSRHQQLCQQTHRDD